MIVTSAQDTWLPAIPTVSSEVKDRIKTVALSCIKQFALSISLKLVISSFVSTPAGLVLLFNTTMIQLIASCFFHSLGGFFSYKADQNGEHIATFETLYSVCEYINAFAFAVLTGYDCQNLIHETGHAIATLFLYKTPNPMISLFPLRGGITEFYKNGLSQLGKSLGPPGSTFIVSAAGPAFTLAISATLLAIGFSSLKENPKISKYLIAWGLVDFFHHAHYAYSALHADQWDLHHDFVHLSVFGVDPKTVSIAIVSVPILIGLGCYLKNAYSNQNETAAEG